MRPHRGRFADADDVLAEGRITRWDHGVVPVTAKFVTRRVTTTPQVVRLNLIE